MSVTQVLHKRHSALGQDPGQALHNGHYTLSLRISSYIFFVFIFHLGIAVHLPDVAAVRARHEAVPPRPLGGGLGGGVVQPPHPDLLVSHAGHRQQKATPRLLGQPHGARSVRHAASVPHDDATVPPPGQ
eukprot:1188141-Prorocentrum_minimum.AAC.1